MNNIFWVGFCYGVAIATGVLYICMIIYHTIKSIRKDKLSIKQDSKINSNEKSTNNPIPDNFNCKGCKDFNFSISYEKDTNMLVINTGDNNRICL